MKARADQLARLQDVRRRLRDVAAGEHAVADGARQRALASHAAAEAHLTGHLDGALARLTRERDVRGLFRFAEEVGAAREHVAAASTAAATATAVADRRAQALRLRARQLRQAEVLLDRQLTDLARAERRFEQTLADERAARMGFEP